MHDGFLKNIGGGVHSVIRKNFTNPYSKLGLSWLDVKKLKHYPASLRKQKFLNGEVIFYDPREFLYGVKEIFLNEIYKQGFTGNAYIIDCGANIGLSVLYLKKICPGARIIAFEPDNKNFDLLVKNLQLQKITDVDVRKEAVWINNSELNFSEEGGMSSKIAEEHSENAVLVKAARLKDLLTQTVDFLKIDIEGAEYKVMEDIRENLHFVNNMFLEYHGFFSNQQELTQIFQWLTEAGFKYYIEKAADIFPTPFYRTMRNTNQYDIQLNIFCFRD